tara:strand:+ start:15193 stop:16341 length:1149 start_codon:yes stop_codon:yes gene_type:complete
MNNQIISMESLSLVTAGDVFVDKGLEPYLQQITDEANKFEGDISTDKGRKAIGSMARKVARSKTFLDGLGKELNAESKNKAKIVDNERKRCREYLDELRDKVRAPLDQYEAQQKEIEAQRLARYDHVKVLCSTLDAYGEPKPVNQLSNSIIELNTTDINREVFGEYELSAFKTKTEGVASLQNAIDKIEAARIAAEEQAEADRLEQEQLQNERDDRIKAEAKLAAENEAAEIIANAERQAKEAQQAVIDSDAKAKQDSIDAEELRKKEAINSANEKARLEQKAIDDKAAADKATKDAAELSEKRRIEAAEQSAANERQRIADEAAEAKRQAEAREANKTHKSKINNAIVKAIMEASDATKEQAKNIVIAMAKREIPHTTISY